LPRIGDPLGNLSLAECHAIEKAQGANDLVQSGPGNARRDQMDLKGAHVVERQIVGRLSKISAEFGDSADVGSLRCRRHVADAHVLDHAAAKRA
jgi:hypothetical protein